MIFGRLNPSVLIEHELNFISKYIRQYIKDAKTLDEKKQVYLKYMSLVNPKEEFYETFIDSFNDEELHEFFNELYEKGIPVMQKPFFDNISLEQLQNLYNEYPEIKEFKFEGIATPLVMGETYMFRLKHEPEFKTSATSTTFTNLSGLPAKSKAYKEHKELYSKTPIRFGNMEISNLELVNNMPVIADLLNSYSNDELNSEELITTLLTNNPFDINLELSKNKSNTSKILSSLFYCLGLEIDKATDLQDEFEKRILDLEKDGN